jgi:hypothetical protein
VRLKSGLYIKPTKTSPARRFPPPWTVEEIARLSGLERHSYLNQ